MTDEQEKRIIQKYALNDVGVIPEKILSILVGLDGTTPTKSSATYGHLTDMYDRVPCLLLKSVYSGCGECSTVTYTRWCYKCGTVTAKRELTVFRLHRNIEKLFELAEREMAELKNLTGPVESIEKKHVGLYVYQVNFSDVTRFKVSAKGQITSYRETTKGDLPKHLYWDFNSARVVLHRNRVEDYACSTMLLKQSTLALLDITTLDAMLADVGVFVD